MNKINTRHLIFIIWGVAIVPLKTYPNIIIQHAGRDAWLSVFIASIIIFIFSTFAVKTTEMTGQYDIVDVFKDAFGEKIGYIAILIFSISLVLILLECTTIEASATRGNLLFDTPYWYILLFFIITAYFAINNGLTSIVIISIVGLSLTFIAGVNLGFMTHKYKDIKYIYPILENGFNKQMIISVIKTIGCYSSISTAFVYFKFIEDKQSILKYTIVALIILIQMEIIAMLGLITTFGPLRSLQLIYPKLLQSQLISLFDFLESGEFFVLLQMVGGWLIKYIITFFALRIIWERLGIYKHYFSSIISLLVFITAITLLKSNFRYLELINIFVTIQFFTLFFMPLLAYLILFIKKLKYNNTSKK